MASMICVGSRFSSYEELQSAITEFEKENKMSFWKREAKTLENASKKCKNLAIARPELKYYMIKYTCIAGGKVHKKKITDDSRRSKTFRQNCPAYIHVLLSADKQYLEIKSMNVVHDHVISETLLRSLPKERRLPEEYQEEVQNSMNPQVEDVSINLGDKFNSFNSFIEIFEIFKAKTHTEFYISESRPLETAKRHYPRCERAPYILKYYSVKYRCVHGGYFKKNRLVRGLRSTSTIKTGCKAMVHLFLSDDDRSLVVKDLNLEHNHDISETIFIEVPTHKKQNLSLKVDVPESNAKKMKYNAQENILQDAENVVLLQDLTNLNASNKHVYITEDGTECAAPYGLSPDETVCAEPHVPASDHNLAEDVTYTLLTGEGESNEPKLCRCGIGTFDLTKQDLMKMEVEEHYHRLEILQLQKAYETERIEKLRHLYDLKIQLAEQELQNNN